MTLARLFGNWLPVFSSFIAYFICPCSKESNHPEKLFGLQLWHPISCFQFYQVQTIYFRFVAQSYDRTKVQQNSDLLQTFHPMTTIYSGALNGLIKVNQKMVFSGLKFENPENGISVWVRNWKWKTWVLKHKKNDPNSRLLIQRAIIR